MVTHSLRSGIMSTSWIHKRHMELWCLAVSIFLIMGFISTADAQVNTYSGKRFFNNSVITVFYHGSTIAVRETIGQALVGCELLAFTNNQEYQTITQSLPKKPIRVSFRNMIKLMKRCESVDKIHYAVKSHDAPIDLNDFLPYGSFKKYNQTAFTGTKWCGKGDSAKTYHDLGVNSDTDRCCRQHKFCPVILKPDESKGNLKNDSNYTRTHCNCDDLFRSCLFAANSNIAKAVITSYFTNVGCIG